MARHDDIIEDMRRKNRTYAESQAALAAEDKRLSESDPLPSEQLDRIAKRYQAEDPGLGYLQALRKAQDANPALVRAYAEERMAVGRREVK